MFLTLAATGFAILLFYMGWKFYRRMDWDEPAEPSPDFQAMHKRQAQLQHIQDVLAEAHEAGKLSKSVVEEFNRYCEAEMADFQAAETAWKGRRKRTHAN